MLLLENRINQYFVQQTYHPIYSKSICYVNYDFSKCSFVLHTVFLWQSHISSKNGGNRFDTKNNVDRSLYLTSLLRSTERAVPTFVQHLPMLFPVPVTLYQPILRSIRNFGRYGFLWISVLSNESICLFHTTRGFSSFRLNFFSRSSGFYFFINEGTKASFFALPSLDAT